MSLGRETENTSVDHSTKKMYDNQMEKKIVKSNGIVLNNQLLREAILLREIIGPPRAKKPYKHQLFQR